MGDRKPRTIRETLRPFYRWHRRIGVIAALFVILLSVTGILLNHNAQFDLNKVTITDEWLLALYDMETPSYSAFGYPTETLTLDTVILDIHTGRFFGALSPYIMDIVALCLIALSLTGIYMWVKAMRSYKRKVSDETTNQA